jgi:hypothetical protein
VAPDAARDHQAAQAGLLQGPPAFKHQGIDHRFLEAAGDIGAHIFSRAGFPQRIEHCSLETAEAEIQARAAGHGPRKGKAAGVAPLGQARQLGATGIRQAQQLGGLVEGFAGGVVYGLAKGR